MIVQTRNLLDAPGYKRAPIPFKPFERVNPATGKALDPASTLTLTMPDGRKVSTTVKAYFDQLDALEQALAQRGRSLRSADAFAGLKPQLQPAIYQKNLLPANYRSLSSADFGQRKAALSAPPKPGSIAVKPGAFQLGNVSPATFAEFKPQLYIGESTESYGTPEFPVAWVATTVPSTGRTKFPLLVEVLKGYEPLVSKLVWQVSDKPFDGTLELINPPGLLRSGSVLPKWTTGIRGTDLLDFQGKMYASFILDFSQEVGPKPANETKVYYLRVIPYDLSGAPMRISNGVIAAYGAKATEIKVPFTEYHSVPQFAYRFPDSDNVPFGVYVKGSGFNSVKPQIGIANKAPEVLGYKATANARLGLRYFNFLSLVNPNEPISQEQDLIACDLRVATGKKTLNGQDEAPGASLNISVFGVSAAPLAFSPDAPGSSNLSLNYDISQSLDVTLADLRFFIGPVPVRVASSLRGSAGVHLYGSANLSTLEVKGAINPYLQTQFQASGGVDAVVAYATLNAELDPLLSADMLMEFSSSGSKPLRFSNLIRGLDGRVYLAVGFYYPCPPVEQVKKLVGFISGSGEIPLCECKWEYEIFNFQGFEMPYQY